MYYRDLFLRYLREAQESGNVIEKYSDLGLFFAHPFKHEARCSGSPYSGYCYDSVEKVGASVMSALFCYYASKGQLDMSLLLHKDGFYLFSEFDTLVQDCFSSLFRFPFTGSSAFEPESVKFMKDSIASYMSLPAFERNDVYEALVPAIIFWRRTVFA